MSVVTSSLLLDERPARQYPESALQRSVHQYLSRALPPDAVHFAVPNGLMRSRKARQRGVGEGILAGVPDLCIIYRSRAYFIELKAARGVLSPSQRETYRRLAYAGAPVMLCRSLPQVEAALRECGVHLRAAVAA